MGHGLAERHGTGPLIEIEPKPTAFLQGSYSDMLMLTANEEPLTSFNFTTLADLHFNANLTTLGQNPINKLEIPKSDLTRDSIYCIQS